MTTTPTTRLDLMHASMQFSDPMGQKEHDIEAIFERAERRGVAWITGTEASTKAYRKMIRKVAKRHGYRLHVKGHNASWIAVRKSLITGGWSSGFVRVIPPANEIPGSVRHWGPRGILWCTFDTADLGRITVIASHYLTGARFKAGSTYGTVNHWAQNKRLARAIGRFAKRKGKGPALVFYGGDQNMDDKRSDTFFGEPLTSVWDDLGKHPGTGHGNIDVIARFNRDGRVTTAYGRVLRDDRFFLFTDHFLVEAGFDVRHQTS
ncbi:hypothetical protein NYO98_10530 [Nocardioides sp. STR2]|uniref:Metal-dependent hydrolase, endonuclease/exonuclease/phosphatase family n=1 Tax=Nocardioides pini TaxID=2975053 RepID=A0ABT4CF27_9ACTN|nr:hypothetical protein [Nocardioides pini]MCY4726714.1 hypothetical protein [Nocardioides pini]